MSVVSVRGEVQAGGVVLGSFRVDAGSVLIDRANPSRRTCKVRLTEGMIYSPSGSTVIPATSRDVFAPFGNELVLYYTVDGVETQLGVFGINDDSIEDTGDDLSLIVTANDRAEAYSRAGFIDFYTIAAGTNVTTAISDLLTSLTPGFAQTLHLATTSYTTPSAPTVFGPGDDPWEEATKLAASIGCELYLDAYGVTTMAPVQDPADIAVSATYAEGDDNTAVRLRRGLSRKNCPNYIIRIGQGSGISTPIKGVAYDSNPDSPTYILGKYGRQVDHKSSNLYATQAQADNAAASDLLLALGRVETLEVDIIPDPTRDVDNVVAVLRDRAGIPALASYVVDSVSLPFGADAVMTLAARAVAAFT